MISFVRIDDAVLKVCKYLQCHHFSNSKRKLVTFEVSEMQYKLELPLWEGMNLVLGVRNSHLSFATSMLCASGQSPTALLPLHLGEEGVSEPVWR